MDRTNIFPILVMSFLFLSRGETQVSEKSGSLLFPSSSEKPLIDEVHPSRPTRYRVRESRPTRPDPSINTTRPSSSLLDPAQSQTTQQEVPNPQVPKNPKVQTSTSTLGNFEATDAPEVRPQTTPMNPDPAPIHDDDHSGASLTALDVLENDLQKYRDLLHPDDIRRNTLEIGVSPLFIYNDSKSNYWYRSYVSRGPGIAVDTSLWITPFWGIHSEYLSTVGNDMSAEPLTSKLIPISQQRFNVGLRSRTYFGISRKAPALFFGFKYFDHRLLTPADDPNRIRLTTMGALLEVQTEIPTSNIDVYTFGFELRPLALQKEVATGISAKSGSKNQTHGLGISFGKIRRFSRTRQLFWKIRLDVDKSFYSGSTSIADPKSLQAASGVSVLNQWTMFQIGFIWGSN